MTMLQHNYQSVCAQLADAEQRAGRPAGSVRLVAVSKTFPAADIREVYTASASVILVRTIFRSGFLKQRSWRICRISFGM